MKRRIETVDMHTGGEPVRIVTCGYPLVEGAAILDKRRFAKTHLDDFRTFLMFEPRGHEAMYGVIPVEPDLPDADMAVLFMHNEGYSTMCGHAVIALGRFAVDRRIVEPAEPTTTVRIQCPCGMIVARVAVDNGRSGAVRFESVPSFALLCDVDIDVEGGGRLAVDIAYGGAFYAILDAANLGLDVRASGIAALTDGATRVSEAVKQQIEIVHPESDDLGFLYGTILTDGRSGAQGVSANVCVFADRQVDRSPTGSGVSARAAVAVAKGQVKTDDTLAFESLTGARFEVGVAEAASVGPHQAVIAEVEGRAAYTGDHVFVCEDDDPLADGFLFR